MTNIKKRITIVGKLIKFVLIVLKIFAILGIVTGLVASVIPFINPDFLMEIRTLFLDNRVYAMLNSFNALEGMEERYRIAVAAGTFIVSMIVLLIYINRFIELIGTMIREDTPFTRDLTVKIRHSAWLMLLMCLYNPAMGISIFLVTLLFSYIFEYGTYLQNRADETNRIQEEMIMSFAEITENKSEQTGKHVRRVAEYSRILAAQMGIESEAINRLRLASTMHDIGKLLIPAEILEKPARLTDEEYAEIKKHSAYGGMLLKNVEGEVMELARTIALDHHERIDGKGYPDGKIGQDISIEGRIVAVADVYDALTSRRSYKEAWDDKRAYGEIVKGRGTQFDADVVDAFIAAYDRIDMARQVLADE